MTGLSDALSKPPCPGLAGPCEPRRSVPNGTEPLVLDQPEDDFYNHLIQGLIVKQIRQGNRNQQAIVVTHEPNIVVNGNVEAEIAMGD